jgi:uncharacterized protein (TIGR02391 family)
MTPEEARYIIAHEHGIDLRKYGLSPEDIDRVRALRASGARLDLASSRGRAIRPAAAERGVTEARIDATDPRPLTPSALFDSRGFHPRIVKSSKSRFVNGQRSDSIRAAFQAVNNRIRKMSGITDVDDGQALAARAFEDKNPTLRMTDLNTVPDKDEHAGVRFLAMGGMRGLRNPRSHADEEWWTDGDVDFVLEALALASLLHRCLDLCEAYSKRAGA